MPAPRAAPGVAPEPRSSTPFQRRSRTEPRAPMRMRRRPEARVAARTARHRHPGAPRVSRAGADPGSDRQRRSAGRVPFAGRAHRPFPAHRIGRRSPPCREKRLVGRRRTPAPGPELPDVLNVGIGGPRRHWRGDGAAPSKTEHVAVHHLLGVRVAVPRSALPSASRLLRHGVRRAARIAVADRVPPVDQAGPDLPLAAQDRPVSRKEETGRAFGRVLFDLRPE